MSREKLPNQLRKQSPTSRDSGAPKVSISATHSEMSEDRRSKGMYHSLIGKPSLRVGLVMGLLMGLCSVLLLAACGGDNSAKGGAGQEHNKSKSGGTAPNKSTRSFAGPPSWLPGPASLAACGGGNSAKGGAGGEHNKSTRSFAGPAST